MKGLGSKLILKVPEGSGFKTDCFRLCINLTGTHTHTFGKGLWWSPRHIKAQCQQLAAHAIEDLQHDVVACSNPRTKLRVLPVCIETAVHGQGYCHRLAVLLLLILLRK